MQEDLVRVRVTCKGVTPLIMNKMPLATLLSLGDKTRKKSKVAAALGTPRERAEPLIYLNRDGDPIIEAKALYSSLVAAGVYVRLDGKRQLSTKTSTTLPSFMTIEDIELPLLDSEGEVAAWEPDIQQGRNPNGGEAVCLVRPRFDDWRFSVKILIDQSEISEDAIRRLFDLAGRRCGLYEYRPNRKGFFGQFVVECWDHVEEEEQAAAE